LPIKITPAVFNSSVTYSSAKRHHANTITVQKSYTLKLPNCLKYLLHIGTFRSAAKFTCAQLPKTNLKHYVNVRITTKRS